MLTNQAGQSLIKRWEGFSLTPYICPADKLTIGWGHLISEADAVKYAGGITQEQANALFAHDVRIAEAGVARFITAPLTANQFAALVGCARVHCGGKLTRVTTKARRMNLAGGCSPEGAN